ncbi:MAG TPA: lasso peptide biosynthesis PqqD family chaperone [Syntrophomonadaceae bacterium]|nr:lasso peptide biosynthesis PqqD family chaperone [Syntrophomonadaceae bacterium]
MINTDTVISKTEGVVLAELDGKVVMMSIENGQYYGLDEVGSIIWEMMSEPVQVKNVINRLMQEYEVTREECEKDVMAFLEKLHEKKLIILK